MDGNLDFLIDWNSEFPLDKWWRQKYKIPFNSENHRSISPQDMLLDFLEDALYKKVVSEFEKKKEKYEPGGRNFLKEQAVDDEDFENLDLSEISL